MNGSAGLIAEFGRGPRSLESSSKANACVCLRPLSLARVEGNGLGTKIDATEYVEADTECYPTFPALIYQSLA
jgi:hypothetical protein